MAACNSCGAAITWAKTTKGKVAPFQVDPKGLWVIVDGIASPIGAGDVPPYYTSHFATCPQAQNWRKK